MESQPQKNITISNIWIKNNLEIKWDIKSVLKSSFKLMSHFAFIG